MNLIRNSRITKFFILSVFSTLTVFLLNGAVITKFRIVINDTDTITTVYTSQSDPAVILEQQDISLSTWDKFDFSGIVDNHGSIQISRAMPISIYADNAIQTLHLTNTTVASALEKAAVAVNDFDIINVSLNEPIVANMNIKINRVTQNIITTQEEIPYNINETKTPTLKDNRRKTLVRGKEGLLEIVTAQKLIDGVVVDEVHVSSTVLKKPVSAKVLVGDSDTAVSKLVPTSDLELDENGNPTRYKQLITGKATAYSSRGKDSKSKPGNVAMDLNQFPKGTKLYIKTPDGSFVYGYSVVNDTGHALIDGSILVDLFFDSYKESCFFGAKNVEIYIL